MHIVLRWLYFGWESFCPNLSYNQCFFTWFSDQRRLGPIRVPRGPRSWWPALVSFSETVHRLQPPRNASYSQIFTCFLNVSALYVLQILSTRSHKFGLVYFVSLSCGVEEIDTFILISIFIKFLSLSCLRLGRPSTQVRRVSLKNNDSLRHIMTVEPRR